MGNNALGNAFANAVIVVYDAGVLTPAIIEGLAKPYHGSDIDFADAEILSKDGLDIEQVVAKIMGLEVVRKPQLPQGSRHWTRAQEDSDNNDDFYEKKASLFNQALKSLGVEFD